ncbi:unnamed protein product, partial [Rotaria sordida]
QGKFAIGSCVSAASTGNYMACVGQLAHKIWTLHNWSEDTPITLCGMQCVGNLNPLYPVGSFLTHLLKCHF